jgi:single-strand DNA-binding protein
VQDINIVSLVGRLTSDPELRSLASGTSVCQMRIAFNTSKRAASGEWEDVGNFVNVTVWGNHGETCAKHLSRGKRVALQGRLQWREWEGQNGKQNAIEIVADRVQFIEPRDSSSDSNQRSTAPRQSAPAPTEDDDVPF